VVDVTTFNNSGEPMMKLNRTTAVAIGAAILVSGSVGVASADDVAKLIGSKDIKDGSVQVRDLTNRAVTKLSGADGKDGKDGKDGAAAAKGDTGAKGEKGDTGATGAKGDTGPAGVAGKDADMSVIHALEARVAALEANAGTGSDVNTNWENGLGATVVDANTVLLDSRNEDGYAYASIRNLDLPVSKGSVIEFTYRLENGAATGWGAPRIQIRINGATYSTAHQINPDYGHANGDGTFTIEAVATSMNDNSATVNPEGTITRASVVYDYQAKGTVTFTNVVIDGQPISFK
jgi:hypothetical protein